MLEVRRAEERGHANHGWLDSYHSFSFADYYDPLHMGFGPLRVINEDHIAPARGFGEHAHRDMEIITYVLEGQLAHRDSMGNGSVIGEGDVQRMSAGTGVRHSEFNASRETPVHLLQIWIQPDKKGIDPGYEEKRFEQTEKRGRLRLIAAPNARDGAVRLQADASVYAALLDGDERVRFEVEPGRQVYVHLARGAVTVNGEPLKAGDAAKLTGDEAVVLDAGIGAEVLLFDLAA